MVSPSSSKRFRLRSVVLSAGVLVVLSSWALDRDQTGKMPYDFSRPAADFDLPRELDEISGLAIVDSNRVIAIQDENARYYVIRLSDGVVESRTDFGTRGDYEGVELVGAVLYVIRSDGDVFVIENWEDRKPKSYRIKTRLSSSCDAEGLAYDGVNHRLLIACKEYPGKGIKNARAVYAFDPVSESINKEPAFLIKRDSIALALNHAGSRMSAFKPAALAIHPISGLVYVVSSRDKLMIVMDTTGRVLASQLLEHPRIRQPEGLAFLPNGDLLLASEAAGKRPSILRFTYQPGLK